MAISAGLQQRFQHNNPKQRRNQHPKNSVRNADETTKRHIRLSSCRKDKHNSNGTHSHVWHVDSVLVELKRARRIRQRPACCMGREFRALALAWVGGSVGMSAWSGGGQTLIFFDGAMAQAKAKAKDAPRPSLLLPMVGKLPVISVSLASVLPPILRPRIGFDECSQRRMSSQC